MNSVRRDARHDELIRKNLEWLETQNGITAEQRLDAYMLGDDSVFPDWAKELPIAYRDRVVCGACGITEYDEATRMRLPTDQRKETWAIMKEKRKSEDGVGRMISHAELWRVATCSRKFSWILRQRLERCAKLRVHGATKPRLLRAMAEQRS